MNGTDLNICGRPPLPISASAYICHTLLLYSINRHETLDTFLNYLDHDRGTERPFSPVLHTGVKSCSVLIISGSGPHLHFADITSMHELHALGENFTLSISLRDLIPCIEHRILANCVTLLIYSQVRTYSHGLHASGTGTRCSFQLRLPGEFRSVRPRATIRSVHTRP